MDIEKMIEVAQKNLERKIGEKLTADRIEAAVSGLKEYRSFYEEFDMTPQQREMSNHKLHHTYGVTSRMLEMADDEKAEAFFWLGLLHDFGRITDILKGTFADVKVGHPDAGANMLFGTSKKIKIFDVPEELYVPLEKGIRLHGVLDVEKTCAEKGIELSSPFEAELVSAIRTADKWDIFSFFLWTPMETTVGASFSQIAESPMANHTMESFKEHRLVNQAAKPFGYKDHWLKHVAFPFDVTDMRLLSWLQDISWVDAYMAPVLVLTEDEEELKKLYFIRDEVKGFISEKISLGK